MQAAALQVDPDTTVVRQAEQLGTAHAVDQARAALADFEGDVVVLFGDTPFLQPDTLARMVAARRGHDLVILGFEPADPARYGRLVMQGDSLEKIVEFKDATEEERAIGLCNSGLMACDAKAFFALLSKVGNDNAQGEYYLTDVVELARSEAMTVTAITCDERETLGINSRADLAHAEAVFQDRARAALMDSGVTLVAPDTVFVAFDTQIERDALIEPNVVFGPGVHVASGATVRAFSHLEGCRIGSGATVGPYARLRPGTDIATGARIGNFVEVKNAQIAQGAKVNHLSYIGDARVGAAANIGAGTITCNYDGVMKHRTDIGDGAFIGSNTMLVAPVKVGDGAMTGSGSVINKDVPAAALGVARARQDNKAGYAAKLFEMLKAKKAQRDKGSS